MKAIKLIVAFIILLTQLNIVNGQSRPKEIKAKENYTHNSTQIDFPKFLFSDYQRKSIYSFDKKNENIGVTYEKNLNGEITIFSLYLYPAEEAFEGRLRGEYLNSMPVITVENKLSLLQYATQHKGEKYICNGFKAIFTNESKDLSQLTIFESGTWFYKLRITTNQADTALLLNLEKDILQNFEPTILTDLNPLNEKVNVYFSKTAFRDSVLLGSAMGSALKKIDWITKNVKENERATGFPDLYLDLHIEALKAFMEFQHKFDYEKSDFTEKYLNELQLISDANFLTEFVMEQHNMILIIPENTPLKYEEYLQWKAENNISINLNEVFYILSFPQKK